MSRVVLSAAAEQDRREITAFTVERFGVEQARRVRSRFKAALELLLEQPLSGRTYRELDPPGHTFRYFVLMGTFIIVYEPTEHGIRVARFLHGARDLAAELRSDPGDATDRGA